MEKDLELKQYMMMLIRKHFYATGKVCNDFRIYTDRKKLNEGKLDIIGFAVSYQHPKKKKLR